jgi:hypothetical protein
MHDQTLSGVEYKPREEVSTRDVLKLTGVTDGLIAAGCKPSWPKHVSTAQPAKDLELEYKTALAIAACYDLKVVKEKVQALLDEYSGLMSLTAVDAVVTAKMGFYLQEGPSEPPFLYGDNYLSLARELGMGTSWPVEIQGVGAALEEIATPFTPTWEM